MGAGACQSRQRPSLSEYTPVTCPLRPGVLTWTTPSGRTYTTTPEPYPT